MFTNVVFSNVTAKENQIYLMSKTYFLYFFTLWPFFCTLII